MEILRVKDLTFTYPDAERCAVDGVSFEVGAGEFVVVCGGSGCGKTTLLRLCSRSRPHGELLGKIECGVRTGFVPQDPESGIVTDTVAHEMSFGLENLAVPTETMRRRVAETMSYFGIGHLYGRRTDELSGGEKQLLNLASATAMQPELLILDEPTAQLDPIAAELFIDAIVKLCREVGISILIAEHRLDALMAHADKVIVMDDGKFIACGAPCEIAELICRDVDARYRAVAESMPASARICTPLGARGNIPLTVRDAREYLRTRYARLSGEHLCSANSVSDVHTEHTENPGVASSAAETASGTKSVPNALELRDIWFRYAKNEPDVLSGLSLTVKEREIFTILGGNGAGKTTALNVIAALDRPYRGVVKIFGKRASEYKNGALYRGTLAMIPQDPSLLFVRDTVREDLCELAGSNEEIEHVADMLGISNLLDRHPFDVSGGEIQRCALAKLMLTKPRIILLDEPTKGLDGKSKLRLAEILREMRSNGASFVIVTHDLEFAAEISDRCALLFDGKIASTDEPRRFFYENSVYTTTASRIARGIFPFAVTCGQVVDAAARAEVHNG